MRSLKPCLDPEGLRSPFALVMLAGTAAVLLGSIGCGNRAAGIEVSSWFRSRHSTAVSASEFTKKLQEQLILASPGSVIELPEGRFQVDRVLSLTVDNVTLRGKGMDRTALSFKGQRSGSAGLLVTANGFTVEDIGFEDMAGDGVKVNGGTNVTFRRVRAEWTDGPNSGNGGYGLYPVQCKNVLIEDSVVKGAADAGIYVGQSQQIVVRRNHVEQNVAGIEIENSQYADVYDNTASNNTGGILVFNIPDLPVKDGRYARVFHNQIYGNNLDNFGSSASMVSKVPPGTGLMIMATKHIEVFGNTIKDNKTGNLMLVSFYATEDPIKDAAYDPYPSSIYVHDNQMSGGGTDPGTLKVKALALGIGKPLPDILYDGITDPKLKGPSGQLAGEDRICIQNNGGATFVNFDAAGSYRHMDRDLASHDCAFTPLEAVNLPQSSAGTVSPGGTSANGNE
ncbi:MAG TPA: parallel beta-helix domain-containing protein [Terriglobia bacterium]